MSDQPKKRGRGRPPKHGEAMSPADRQRLYAAARGRDMAEVAYALKDALQAKGTPVAFIRSYKGTQSGKRLRRGLARLLADDQDVLAFFDELILSDDEKQTVLIRQVHADLVPENVCDARAKASGRSVS